MTATVVHTPKAGTLLTGAEYEDAAHHTVNITPADIGAVTLADVIDTLHPVGSIYTSVLATNPATLFGRGTWSAFGAGRVLIGNDGATYPTDEGTGGAATSAVSAHSGATVADHAALTHAGTAVGTSAGGSAHTHTQGAVTQPSAHVFTQPSGHSNHVFTQPSAHADNIAHVHGQNVQGGTTAATTGTHIMTSTAVGGSARAITTGDAVLSQGTGSSLAHSGAGVDAHSAHAGGAVDAHSGTAVANPANESAHTHAAGTVTQPSNHGIQAHTVGQAVDHTAVATIQPYIVVHMWKRTA